MFSQFTDSFAFELASCVLITNTLLPASCTADSPCPCPRYDADSAAAAEGLPSAEQVFPTVAEDDLPGEVFVAQQKTQGVDHRFRTAWAQERVESRDNLP